jgi:hypothetical protein
MRYAFALAAVLLASPAAADIIGGGQIASPQSGFASNDPPSTDYAQQVADDFAVWTLGARIDRIEWWGNYSQDESEADTTTAFTIRIIRDAASYGPTSPVNEPPVFSQDVTTTALVTGISTTGDDREVFRYSVDFAPPIDLIRGAYWLSILESDPTTVAETWEWQNTLLNTGTINHARNPPDDLLWHPVAADPRRSRAFVLIGELFGNVPEPSSAVLFVLGCCGLAHRHHRRKVK